ncbi:hypothetical protein J6590_044710 [Homalodisca vitripennis]|nr:hypothetical protein J6590_044710 [Homalodisca vitripennis]
MKHINTVTYPLSVQRQFPADVDNVAPRTLFIVDINSSQVGEQRAGVKSCKRRRGLRWGMGSNRTGGGACEKWKAHQHTRACTRILIALRSKLITHPNIINSHPSTPPLSPLLPHQSINLFYRLHRRYRPYNAGTCQYFRWCVNNFTPPPDILVGLAYFVYPPLHPTPPHTDKSAERLIVGSGSKKTAGNESKRIERGRKSCSGRKGRGSLYSRPGALQMNELSGLKWGNVRGIGYRAQFACLYKSGIVDGPRACACKHKRANNRTAPMRQSDYTRVSILPTSAVTLYERSAEQ